MSSEMMQIVLNSKKVKYAVLEPLIEKNLPSDTQEVNIFISIETVLKQFYNPKLNETVNSLDSEDKFLLSSEIINIVAHYRHFFYSRYNMPSNYFLYYSSAKAFYNLTEDSNYRKDYYDKRLSSKSEFYTLNKMIKKNLELANILSEYLPNVHIIDTKSLEPSVLPYYIINNNEGVGGLTNLILTNNQLDYQLANLDRTFILNLKMDDSEIISKDGLMAKMLKSSKIKNSTPLDPNFYTSVLSISGYKPFNIDGLKGYGYTKVISKLEKAVTEGKISNDELSANMLLTCNQLFSDQKQIDVIKKNYKVLSYENLFKNMSPKELHNIDNQINNKSDNMSLLEINRTYYERYPLMLIELMEGEC